MWENLFNENHQPTYNDVKCFINNDLWNELCTFIETECKSSPKMDYSKCSMQKGWNIKYKKRGRSLCTLYHMDGYFIALIVIGEREKNETELVMSSFSSYLRELYHKTPFSLGGQWLMIDVKEKSTLEDVFKLLQIRARS